MRIVGERLRELRRKTVIVASGVSLLVLHCGGEGARPSARASGASGEPALDSGGHAGNDAEPLHGGAEGGRELGAGGAANGAGANASAGVGGEAAGAPNLPRDDARYLLFIGGGSDLSSLMGLEIGGDRDDGPPRSLGDGAFDEEYPFSSYGSWSPDGRFFVFDTAWTDFESEFRNRFFYIDFAGSEPSPARRVPDLPAGLPIALGEWDAASSAITFEIDAAVYTTRFDASGAAATQQTFSSTLEPDELRLCRGGGVAAAFEEENGWLVDGSALDSPISLGPALGFNISPDGRQLALLVPAADEQPAKLELVGCDAAASKMELGEHPTGAQGFSPDSRYLAATFDEDGGEELRVFSTDSHEVMARRAFEVEFSQWSADGEALLVNTLDEEMHVWRWRDDAVERLPTGTYDSCSWLSDYLVCERSRLAADDSVRGDLTLRQPFSLTSPLELVHDVESTVYTTDASQRRVTLLSEALPPSLLQFELQAPNPPRRRSLSEIGEGELAVRAVARDGATVLDRSYVGSQLWLLPGSGRAKLIVESPVGTPVWLQP